MIEVEKLYEVPQPKNNISYSNTPVVQQSDGFEFQKSIYEIDSKNKNDDGG